MVGGGKLLGVCAFLSESKGTLTLSGDITGEAEAVMNGSNGYASFAAAAAPQCFRTKISQRVG